MTGPHQPPPGGGYSKVPSGRQRAAADPSSEVVERLETLIKVLTSADSDVKLSGTPSRRTADSASETILLTKRIKRYRLVGGALLAALLAIGTVAANLYAYLQGYAADRAAEIIERRATSETARKLLERVEANTQRIESLQKIPPADTSDLEQKIEDLRVLNGLQWAYMSTVVEAIQARRKPPGKSQALLQAERNALGPP